MQRRWRTGGGAPGSGSESLEDWRRRVEVAKRSGASLQR